MATAIDTLNGWLDELLEVGAFADYCPNGLQVEGRAEVCRLMTGVTACQALLDEAVAWGADALLVHHGWFWRGEDAALVGIKRRRVATLLGADINLLAYHLPLDAHPHHGNNARLAARLDLRVTGPLETGRSPAIGMCGELAEPVSGETLAARIEQALGRRPLHIAAERPIGTVGWCTGAAQGMIDDAIARGVDAYITGEVSEPTVHAARENGIHFFAAGHHATERYGVQAVGELAARTFGLEHRFVDIDNPA